MKYSEGRPPFLKSAMLAWFGYFQGILLWKGQAFERRLSAEGPVVFPDFERSVPQIGHHLCPQVG